MKYLDYELINASMREAAKVKYNDEVDDKEGAVKDEEKQIDQDLIDAKIEITDGMLEYI